MGDDLDGRPQPEPAAAQPEAQESPDAGAAARGGSLREGLSALRGTRGASGERLDAERDAVSGLRVSAGQVFAGDSYVFNLSGGASVRSYRLSAVELDEVREAYVEPAGFSGLVAALGGRTVVVLRGAPGSGKDGAARAALLRAGHRELSLLDPATDLATVESGDLRQGAGYVLADLTQRAADALTSFELRRLEGVLRARRCRLVITAAPGLRFTDPGVQHDVVEAPESPAASDIVTRHLEWRLGVAEAALGRRVLARPDVRQLLGELLGGAAPATPATAAELGRALADAAADGAEDEVADLVRRRQRLRDDQAIADWMQGLDDLAQQCLAIAVAAFGGEAYEIVATLARDLEERLQVEESPDNPVRPRGTKLGGTRSRRLAAIRGTLVESEVATRHGGARGKVVRFQDPGVAVRVLEHVWSEYDEIREVLPTWLRDSAAGVLPTVGVRAAVAAGVLARHGFEMVRSRILNPWAAAEDSELRDAAAIALGVAAKESGHALAAYNLVLAWSAPGARPELRATAARSWRVVFERDGDEQAWSWLHQLAETENVAVVEALCRSLTEYMALDGGRYRRDALDLIDQWAVVGAHGPLRRLVGELAFLYAAGDLIDAVRQDPYGYGGGSPAPAPSPGAAAALEPEPVVWPTLLAVTEHDPEQRAEVAALWRQAINSPTTYRLAHDVLTEWAYLVEPQPRGRTALAALLADAATDRRTPLILRHLADSWVRGSEGRGAARTGHVVLAQLDGRSGMS